MTPRFLYRIVAYRYPSFRLMATRLFGQTLTPIPVQSMSNLNDAPDLQTLTASGVTATDLFYVWDTSALVAKTITFTEQRKLTLEVVESAPNNGTAATVNLNPHGDNNTIRITAPSIGTAGNSLTAAIVIDSSTDRTQLTVAKASNAITITSGDKRRMVITGTIDEPSGPPITLPLSMVYSGQVNGRPSYTDVSTNFVLSWSGSNWVLDYSLWAASWVGNGDTPYPDDISITWTGSGTGTGEPTVTASAATAAQVITAGNAALEETFENGSGSDGSGAVAAVSLHEFSGGAVGTVSNAPFLVNGSTLYVNVGTVAAPEWKEKELDNLS